MNAEVTITTSSSNKWEAPILNWVSSQLGSQITQIDDYEILRGESIDGCLIKANTQQGNYYIKAVGRYMEHEPRILKLLSQLTKHHVPEIIGFDDDLHWILMKEVQGHTLDQQNSALYYKDMLSCYAQMQIQLSKHVDKFLILNTPIWELDDIKNSVESFKYEFFDLMSYTDNPISSSSFDRVADLLTTLITSLNAYNIPSTLVHGDFHLSNIIVTDNNVYKFIDWNEGYIGHPFYVLADFLAYIGSLQPKPTYSSDELCHAYLHKWSNYLSLSNNIYDVYKIARPIAVLRYAMRCIQCDHLYGDNSIESKRYLANYMKSLFKQISQYAQLAV